MPRPCVKMLLATLVFVAACGDEPTQPPVELMVVRDLVRFPNCVGPVTSVDPAFDVTLPLETYLQNHELFAALARELPGGFAGVFNDRSQSVLLLADPSREASARAAIAPYLSSLYGFDLASAQVREARWDFAQLANWYNYIFRYTAVRETPGVTYSDTDVMLNRILIGVANADGRQRVIEALAGTDLPCDLIALEIR